MAERDMTKRQFIAALRRHGVDISSPALSIGYVEMPVTGGRVGIYRHNAGPRLRDQLAYLLKERDRYEEKRQQFVAAKAEYDDPQDHE